MASYRTWIFALSMAGFLPGLTEVNAQVLPPPAPPADIRVAPPAQVAPILADQGPTPAVEQVVPMPSAPGPVAPAPSAEQLPALARAAKETFVPITQADLDKARTELQEAINFLNSRLQTAGPEAEDWRKYLMWEELQKELAKPAGPDLGALDKIYARFAAGYEGLELVWFEAVSDALRQYLNTARAIDDKDLPEQYRKLLDELAKHLEAYLKEPSPEEASAIATGVEWLQSAGQAKGLIEAIRANFVRPNMYAQASCGLVAAAVARAVDEIQPVEDCILEVAIRGTGHARGQATAQLIPNPERAQINIVFNGTVNSNTIGFAERNVRVFSTGITQILTRKPVFLEPERIWAMASAGDAQTQTNIDDIEAQRRIVERIAWRRARQQQPLADAIAAQHAAQRANAQADAQGDPQVARADQRYQTQVRQPLYERNIYPQMLRYFTTAEAVHAVGLEGGPADLGASTVPPPVAQPLDLTVQLHESMVNNMIEGLFGGAVMTEERFQKNLTELFGTLPERFKSDDDGESWTITFARRQPISVHFKGANEFSITVRGRSYARDDERYPGMNVTANYRIEQTPEGAKAIRQGAIEIYPPGFQPGGEKKLSVRQQVLRDLLERRFDKMFDKEFRPQDIQLRGQQEQGGQDIGSLTLVGWEVNERWMTTTWKRLPPAPVVPLAATQPELLQTPEVQPAVLTQPTSAPDATPLVVPTAGQSQDVPMQNF